MARKALSTDEQRQLTQQTSVDAMGPRLGDIEQAGYQFRYKWAAPVVASTTNMLAATALGNGVTTTVTAFLAQPDVARNIQVTVALAAGNLVGNVVLTGTDINGNAISEAIAVTAAATYQSVFAYKTLASAVFPVRTTAGDTIALGVGTKMGLPKILFSDSLLLFQTDLAKDTYTLTKDTTAVGKNLIVPNTAANGARNYKAVWLDERD